MKNLHHKNIPHNLERAQALAELAIFGSLILICFSILITYALRFDYQQKAKMEAFRMALKKAYDLNASVTYTMKKDTRFLNLFGGFGQGQPSSTSASASVMWNKGLPGPHGNPHTNENSQYAFYNINGKEIGDPNTGLDRHEKWVEPYDNGNQYMILAPVSVWNEESRRASNYTSESGKTESPSGIINSQASNLTDVTNVTLSTRFDNSTTRATGITEPTYVYSTPPITQTSWGFYNPQTNRVEFDTNPDRAGNVIQREREWKTDD